MGWNDGVSRLTGKLMVHKTEDSGHSSQQQKSYEYIHNYPFMAESCGGADDDRDVLVVNNSEKNEN